MRGHAAPPRGSTAHELGAPAARRSVRTTNGAARAKRERCGKRDGLLILLSSHALRRRPKDLLSRPSGPLARRDSATTHQVAGPGQPSRRDVEADGARQDGRGPGDMDQLQRFPSSSAPPAGPPDARRHRQTHERCADDRERRSEGDRSNTQPALSPGIAVLKAAATGERRCRRMGGHIEPGRVASRNRPVAPRPCDQTILIGGFRKQDAPCPAPAARSDEVRVLRQFGPLTVDSVQRATSARRRTAARRSAASS